MIDGLMVGAVLYFVPVMAPFDPRIFGVVLGAMYSAVDQFGPKRAG